MKNKENEKYIKQGTMLVVVIVIGMICFYLISHSASIFSFFNKVVKILMSFIYGAVIAYLLTPLCNRFERLLSRCFSKKPGLVRGLSIFLSLLCALLLIIILFILVVPNVVQSLIQIAAALPGQLENASAALYNLLDSMPELQASWTDFSEKLTSYIESWLTSDLLPLAQSMVGNLGTHIAALLNLLKNMFLGVLISVYLLGSRKTFARQAKMLLCSIFPKKWAALIEEEVHYADKMFNGFLVGRLVDSAIVGVICFIFSLLFGFESAVLVSVIVGVTNVIPVFGPFIGAIPCALILLLENPLHCLIFLIFIVILQQVDGNVIGPRILGETTGVSSFWVLFSVMLFGGLWGLLGMIIGVPLFAVLYDIVRKLTYAGLKKRKRDDLIKTP